MNKNIKSLLLPNQKVDKKIFVIICLFELLIFLSLWQFKGFLVLPKPIETFDALINLITKKDLIDELLISTFLCIKSMVYATIISIFIASLYAIVTTRPISYMVSIMRFLPPVGLPFVFLLLNMDLKSSWMIFAITTFLVTAIIPIVKSITKSEMWLAQTIRFKPIKAFYELVLVGKLSDIIDVIRQTFAIAWMTTSFVEAIVQKDGGIGRLLYQENRINHIDSVFAILFIYLITGVIIDRLLYALKFAICPYTKLTLNEI